MRRSGPRPLGRALEQATLAATPATLLARVQASWGEVAGRVLAEEARPVSESAGAVVVECRSAAWANELDLLEGELRERLNAALAPPPSAPVRELRFRVGGGARNRRKPA